MNQMTARSYLYVPGNRPEMLAGAGGRGSDAVVADLEDAVPPASKETARANVATWLGSYDTFGPQPWVRINAHDAFRDADLESVLSTGARAGVMLPKATVGVVAEVAEVLPKGVGLIPLIETAQGVLELPAISAVSSVIRLGLGGADLVADLGMEPSPGGEELIPILIQLVVASAAAEIASPIAPVWTNLDDAIGLERSTIELRRLGFGARSAIHPKQVPVINHAFTPEAAKVERARRLLRLAEEAAVKGAAVYLDEDGRFVDEAVLRAARRHISLAEEYGTR